eukprot:6174996-Pleurochrysis_carterae.AAC.3
MERKDSMKRENRARKQGARGSAGRQRASPATCARSFFRARRIFAVFTAAAMRSGAPARQIAARRQQNSCARSMKRAAAANKLRVARLRCRASRSKAAQRRKGRRSGSSQPPRGTHARCAATSPERPTRDEGAGTVALLACSTAA